MTSTPFPAEEGGRAPKWERITPENYERLRMVLVTNHPGERRANDGRMSHLWLAQMVFMDRATGEFTAFDSTDSRKLHGLTHYYEAPNADV